LHAIPKRMFLTPSFTLLGLDRADSELRRHLDSAAIAEVGLFSPLAVAGLRLAHACLPRQSAARRRCEEALLYVLSFGVLHELFVADSRGYLARARAAGRLDKLDTPARVDRVSAPLSPCDGAAAG